MSNIVLVTNTRWSEAPRLRHQVARLLRDAGARVLFLERPNYLWQGLPPRPELAEPGVWLSRGERLFHHQLRIARVMRWIDASLLSKSIREIVASWNGSVDFAIVNFSHDAAFLRSTFPGRKILTIIHDDFEAQSRLPWKSHISNALQATCESSDHVFAVSDPLMERLADFCSPELFLPWSVSPYREPSTPAVGRNKLLFWGYVDSSLDLELVERISSHLAERGPNWQLWLVGPTQTRGVRRRIVDRLSARPNIRVLDARPLSDLPLDETLAAVLPYRRIGITDAVTLANKSMQLLACGLPLLISAMPRFHAAPFVIRLDGDGGIDGAMDVARSRFEALQPDIERFCASNSPEVRLEAIARALHVGLPKRAAGSLPPAKSAP